MCQRTSRRRTGQDGSGHGSNYRHNGIGQRPIRAELCEFTVLEGTACLHVDGVGQSLQVMGGQMIVYDPIYRRLEDPVEVDLQQQLSSPLVRDFRRLPSAGLIEEEIQSQHQVAAPNGDLDRAVRAAGAASIESATPDQFMAAFSSLLVRYPPSQRHTLVAGAMRARPDLADRIPAVARGVHARRGATTGKTEKIIKSTKARKLRFQSRVRDKSIPAAVHSHSAHSTS